ncbi:hypothetical protein MRB53_038556 [Persea americana]|nr:hypothetical protein MRB53_038556 [Persea americana]
MISEKQPSPSRAKSRFNSRQCSASSKHVFTVANIRSNPEHHLAIRSLIKRSRLEFDLPRLIHEAIDVGVPSIFLPLNDQSLASDIPPITTTQHTMSASQSFAQLFCNITPAALIL